MFCLRSHRRHGPVVSANTQVTAHTAKVSMVESAGMSVKDGRDRQVLATGVKGEANSFEANSDMLVEPVGEAAKNLQDPSK